MRLDHLSVYGIKVRCIGPVFIGGGVNVRKKECIFDAANQKLWLPNMQKLIAKMDEHQAIEQYEAFLLPRSGYSSKYNRVQISNTDTANDLYAFLKGLHIKESEFPDFCDYSVSTKSIGREIRDVQTFLKGSDGKPYMPGSSFKGALRTCVAAYLLKRQDPSELKRRAQRYADDVAYTDRLRSLRTADELEKWVFRAETAPKTKVGDAVNDIMRGVRISDSLPVAYEKLILCKKTDRCKDGSEKDLPIYRECIRPGTVFKLSMTLDQRILDSLGINQQLFFDALDEFEAVYHQCFEDRFPHKDEDADSAALRGHPIYIGGGAGYATKTLAYPLWGDKALPVIADILTKQFRRHGHQHDGEKNVSPHMYKLAQVSGKFIPMGKCEIKITEEA